MLYKQLKDEAVGMKDVEFRAKAKGKAEGEAYLIRAMLQKGRSVSQIADFTGLTAEEVKLSQ